MKRLARKYLSAALLLCLLIELVPSGLLHSHEDHSTEVGHDIDSIHTADANYSGCVAEQTHHESSENECNVCKVQQHLNNQSYTVNKSVHAFNFAKQSTFLLNSEVSVDDHLIKSTSGRAPPFA